MPYLRSQHLLGYVDGSLPEPALTMTKTVAGGAAQEVPNPAHATWLQQDQLVLCALLSSLSE